MMGHESTTSTFGYAVVDAEKVKRRLMALNKYMTNNLIDFDFSEIKRLSLDSDLRGLIDAKK